MLLIGGLLDGNISCALVACVLVHLALVGDTHTHTVEVTCDKCDVVVLVLKIRIKRCRVFCVLMSPAEIQNNR